MLTLLGRQKKKEMNTSGHRASSHGQFIVIVACRPVFLVDIWSRHSKQQCSSPNAKSKNTPKETIPKNTHTQAQSTWKGPLWEVCLPSELLTSWHHPSSAVDEIWQNAPQVSVQSVKLSWGGLSDLLLLSTKCSAAAKENTAVYWQNLWVLETHTAVFLTVLRYDLRDYISKTSVVYVRLQFTVHSLTALMLSWTVHLLMSGKCTDCGSTPRWLP